jgi:hypothetical protein
MASDPSWIVPDGPPAVRREVWEGSVLGVDYDVFRAELMSWTRSVDGGDRPCIYFERAAVSDVDKALVEPGALFWLVEERVTERDGHTVAQSQIRFRRIFATKAWSYSPHDELETVREEWDELGAVHETDETGSGGGVQ